MAWVTIEVRTVATITAEMRKRPAICNSIISIVGHTLQTSSTEAVRVLCTYPSKNVGHTAAPAAANGENTSEKLEDSGSKGNAEGDEDIFRRSTIGIHVLVQVTGEEILELRFIGASNVGQLPDFDGVEPEIGLGLRTERRVKVFAVLPGDIAITVAQQSDRVEVLDIQLVLGFFQHLGEVLVFVICADSLEEIGKFIGSF